MAVLKYWDATANAWVPVGALAAVGPQGPSGGITRPPIAPVTGNTTMGSDINTDYVYSVEAVSTLTLPTAVGNTNRYTVKNNFTSDITINTTASQTIDGTTTITIAPGDAVDLISNDSNWSVV